MSDFLVSFKPGVGSDHLLRLLRMPFTHSCPEGEGHEFPWGAVGLLRDPIFPDRAPLRSPRGLLASVGDLLMDNPAAIAEGLFECALALRDGRLKNAKEIEDHPAFKSLNGAFAILLAEASGPALITDPLGSVQVYAGTDQHGNLTALGTHPDLVACLSAGHDDIDPVSVFEFLNLGTPCFPHTMHARVRELAPGRLHTFIKGSSGQMVSADEAWWPFPKEFDEIPHERDLAAGLGNAFASAVADRCPGGAVGVTLSGGLDSRLVMAAIPESTPCIGFTFCDVINREARLARTVARCYGRDWVPLFRDSDYIARTALDTVKFIGCEGDWVNAHGMGFVPDIAQHNVRTVFTGLLMNNNVKGYYAADVHRMPRWGGLLPPRYEIGSYDYVGELKPFSSGIFREGLLEHGRSRRKTFLENHPGMKRQSVAEWLDGYPFSQAPDNTGWVAERRLMPVRLPAMDRRLLDIACRIPMPVKAGGAIFTRMARPILGKGAHIPDANDGVRPGSGHVWRLLQRALRKAQNTGRKTLGHLGMRMPVPISWHDYQLYWRESTLLQSLVREHGHNLREFEGTVFQANPTDLLANPNLSWLHGFRLVQLALWKSVLRQYRAGMPVSHPASISLAAKAVET